LFAQSGFPCRSAVNSSIPCLILDIHTSNRFYFNYLQFIVYYYNRILYLDVCFKYIYLEIFTRSRYYPTREKPHEIFRSRRNLLVCIANVMIWRIITWKIIIWRKIAAIKRDLFFPLTSRRSFQKVRSPSSYSLNETCVCHLTFFGSQFSAGYVRIP